MGNVNSNRNSNNPAAAAVYRPRTRGRPVPSQTPELENSPRRSSPELVTRSRSSLSLRSQSAAAPGSPGRSAWTKFKRFLSVPGSFLLGKQQQPEDGVEALDDVETSEAEEAFEKDFVVVVGGAHNGGGDTGMDLGRMSREIKQIGTESSCKDVNVSEHPLLVDTQAIMWIKSLGNKVVFLMRGLSGSGKSTLVKKLAKVYASLDPLICSADHYFIDPDSGEYTFDQNCLQEAHASSVAKFRAGIAEERPLVIVDNTNVLKWEMSSYFKVANHAGYQVVLVEPQTPWKLDPSILVEKNTHGVSVEVLRKKVRQFKPIPALYFAWFANRLDSKVILDTGLKWLERCLNTCKLFNADFCAFSSMINLRSQLNYYSRNECQPSNRNKVHCTARFFARDESEANLEYLLRPEVQQGLGGMFNIDVIGFVITKDTLGARVLLSPSELSLWGQDDGLGSSGGNSHSAKSKPAAAKMGSGSKRQREAAAKTKKPSARERRRQREEEKELEEEEHMEYEAEGWPVKDNLSRVKVEDNDRFGDGGSRFCPIPGTGCRAHLTLGTRDGIKPVSTGTDLLEAVRAEKEQHFSRSDGSSEGRYDATVKSFHIEGAVLRQYADGLWVLYPDKRWILPAMFTGHYL